MESDNGLSISNWPFVTVSSTSNGVTGATYNNESIVTGMLGRLQISLRAPVSLTPGTYTDTVSVRACLDANCIHELA